MNATTPKIARRQHRGRPLGRRSGRTRSTGRATSRAIVSAFGSQREGDCSHGPRRDESGREDLNLRPPGPQPGALPGCATPRGRPHPIAAGPRCPASAGPLRVPRRWARHRSSRRAPTTSPSGTRTSWPRRSWPRTAPSAARWSSAPTATACGSGCSPTWTPASRPATRRTSTCRCSSRSRTSRREAEHVEGFSPELAVVTVAGGKELEEPLVVRPTSETLFGELMAKWIQSYRDLPLLLNQWCQRRPVGAAPADLPAHHRVPVAGGAHRPRDAVRTPPRTPGGSSTTSYRDFMVELLAMPVHVGVKTARERFAGAINTMTVRGHDGRRPRPPDGHEPRARHTTSPSRSGCSTSTTRGRSSTAGPPRGAPPPA